MKQSILSVLAALLTAMKAESRRYHPMIVPLVQSSIELESETRPYLLEDALELWAAILAQTLEPTPDIISLTQYLFPIFDTAADYLRKALEITESYFLLAPQAMLENSTRFLSAFANLLGAQLKREANGSITHLVQILIRAAESLGGSPAVETLTQVLIDTRFLHKIMSGLKNTYDAHQTTGPNRVYSNIDGIVETDYLSVLARIAYARPYVFATAIANIAHVTNENFDETITWLLTEWFSHLENIGDPTKKKLMCLALTAELTTIPQVRDRLQELMTLWTDMITELVVSVEDGGDGRDSLVYWDPDGLEQGGESPEDSRRRNVR